MPNHIHGIIVIESGEEYDLSIVRATRPSMGEIRDTNNILVDQVKDEFDGSPRLSVRATRPSTEESRDTNNIPVDQMKDNLDGSPQQIERATRPSVEECRDTHDILVDHVKDNIDGSPQQIGRATRPSTEESRDTNDILVDQMMGNLDGSPQQGSPQQTRRPIGPEVNSLGAMIGRFKSLATKRIWALANINRHPIWQRNYYEHIIRDDLEYQRIVQYIENNPLQWHEDQLHPSVD